MNVTFHKIFVRHFQKLHNTEEVKCSLERQHNQLTADLSKSEVQTDILLNGFHNDTMRQNDVTPHQVGKFTPYDFKIWIFISVDCTSLKSALVCRGRV